MIRNDRQYGVTKRQRGQLLAQLDELRSDDQTPAWVLSATQQAITGQILDLDTEIAEYDALRSGAGAGINELNDLAALPHALVRARIAAGLTQRDLAERLGMREQQIQRYEANEYAGASLKRLEEVMAALDLTFRGEMTLPSAVGGGTALRRNLSDLGIARSTINRRFFGAESGVAPTSGWMNAAARAARVFKADIEDVIGGRIPLTANAGAFRASAVVNRQAVNGYAHYAAYLAELLVRCSTVEYRALPDLAVARDELGDKLRTNPLEALTRWTWEHGVPVLPLSDPGTFYGGCWQIDERPAIALKHGFRSPDRWAFLLGHEIEHARHPSDSAILESDLDAREWRELPEEEAADDFASELLLGDAAEAMLRVAIDRADGNIARLKTVLPAVAAAGNVSIGLLADYAANRLSSQGINWWPTATTLHESTVDAWSICRSVLFDYIDLSRLDTLDREILIDGIGL